MSKIFKSIYIIVFELDFIFDQIVVKFLKHNIENLSAKLETEWKILFINNHKSYIISKFWILANNNYIHFFIFIFYMTYCIQSLNIEIFQNYK